MRLTDDGILVCLLQILQALAGVDANLFQRWQLLTRLLEFIAAPCQFFCGSVPLTSFDGCVQLTLYVPLILRNAAQVLVECDQTLLDRSPPRCQGSRTILMVCGIYPNTAPSSTVSPVRLGRDPLPAVPRPLFRAFDTANKSQLAQQPHRRRSREPQHCEQAVGLGLARCFGSI